jgi:hypothetical protein
MSSPQSQTDPKGRRVSVDLSTAAAAEVDRLRALTSLSSADLFRFALTLFRLYVDAKQSGCHLGIVGPENDVRTRIELPFLVPVESVGRPPAPAPTKESSR